MVRRSTTEVFLLLNNGKIPSAICWPNTQFKAAEIARLTQDIMNRHDKKRCFIIGIPSPTWPMSHLNRYPAYSASAEEQFLCGQ